MLTNQNYLDLNATQHQHIVFVPPVLSDWQCHLFGSDGTAISWIPLKGKEPNCFWRWTQYIVFGNKWVKRNAV